MSVTFPPRAQNGILVFMAIRRAVTWVAIYAIALQTILLGISPLSSSTTDDTFFVICRNVQAITSIDQMPGGANHFSGHGCDHCVLCNASVSPLSPATFLDTVLSISVAHVFLSVLLSPTIGIASNPKLARGPPAIVET
jgi:hypothetical protein